ncbi:MAG: leucine-rich repeat domain-containing protein, partial [Christensenellales bacterium]
QLKEVTIPACYKTIGNSAFAGCVALEKVVFSADSELEEIGINAFGVERDDGNIVSSCEKLNFEKLPDAVTKVGDFAFYKCSSLALDGIPSGLNSVSMYAFSGTLINNVDFVNVTKIFEGGFFECSALDSVRGTENVVKCAKYAFDKTKLESDAKKEYNENRTEVGCYADTILFGVIDNFGTGIGNGKYRIKESATLIADNAFDGEKQTELTLYIDTPAAKAALDNNISFIGENVFRKAGNGYPTGVFVVVGEGLSDRYKEKYSAGSDDYSELFAEEEVVDVTGEDNADVVNWGKHVLLLRGEAYYYDRYVPYGEGAYTVKIGNLKTQKTYPVVRVNMNSFVGVKNMKTLELKGVRLIAYMAVVNCVNLNAVDLTQNTVSLTMPEHATALPVGVEIRVGTGSYVTYRQRWADNGFNTLCNQLKAVDA